MQLSNSPPNRKSATGFALPAILVVVGALLILAVGILLVVGIERNTAHSFADRERANLAARAGLEDVKGIFNLEATNDDFLVLQSTLAAPITTGSKPAPQLFLARGKALGNGYSYRYMPLFSASKAPAQNSLFAAPAVEPLVGAAADEYNDFMTLPYNDKVRASWLPIKDEKDRTVARYAYWVEDLQSRIDPTLAGNQKGDSGAHQFNKYPFPAPGLNPAAASENETSLDRIGLYAIDGIATDDKPGDLEKTLIRNRKVLVSPDSLLAAAGLVPPMARLKEENPKGKIGQLSDAKSRSVEEGLAAGLRSYKEQPVIPFVDGIAPTMAGQPKLNLNKLLATGGDAAVDEMAGLINKALPKFKDRNPAFPAPEDYVKTLAANAIDYADLDGNCTLKTGSYRGIDAFPLMSEFLMSFKWSSVRVEKGRKYAIIEVTTYAELWNMTDKEIKDTDGQIEVSYETKYEFPLYPNPSVSLNDLTNATATLTESDGYRWFPAFTVNLKPDQYKVVKCGTVIYKIDGGSSSGFILSPITMGGEEDGASKAGFRIKWNGKIVDRSAGGVNRYGASMFYPGEPARDRYQQRIREFVPSHSHRKTGVYKDNMGDARMSYYLQAPADQYKFPYNYSPNRRNLRFGNVYNGNTSAVYGRVMPSEWPDGGHNSEYGSNAFFSTYGANDESIAPDDARFFNASELPVPRQDEAPVRLSNLGRFYSATELGRVSDPLLWKVELPAVPNQPWGDIMSSTKPDADHGGGNTLRIGRPEHPRFAPPNDPGLHAVRWLDLFHAGISRSNDNSLREGVVVEIEGNINLNTASRDALRALAAGPLSMDPKLSTRTSEIHDKTRLMAPPGKLTTLSPPTITEQADRIADAIIRSRPYAATSNLALAKEGTDMYVFGNRNLFPETTKIEWADAAAEELFSRIYEASTVRSRNFRIWVVGQSLVPSASTTADRVVLAEVRKVFTVFADPGQRDASGAIDPTKAKLTILHENDF